MTASAKKARHTLRAMRAAPPPLPLHSDATIDLCDTLGGAGVAALAAASLGGRQAALDWVRVRAPALGGSLGYKLHRLQLGLHYENVKFLRSFGSEGGGDGRVRYPCGVAVDGAFVLVADNRNHRVCVFKDGAFVRSFGSKGEGAGQLKCPYGVAVDGEGNVLVADCWNHRVCVFGA